MVASFFSSILLPLDFFFFNSSFTGSFIKPEGPFFLRTLRHHVFLLNWRRPFFLSLTLTALSSPVAHPILCMYIIFYSLTIATGCAYGSQKLNRTDIVQGSFALRIMVRNANVC